MNTKITYFYTDAGNYHSWSEVVVEGEFTEEGIDRIMETLWDDESFVPEMIGFPATRGDGRWDDEIDHIYFDIDESSFELTDEECTPVLDSTTWTWHPITWDEAVARFEMGGEEGWIPSPDLMIQIEGE